MREPTIHLAAPGGKTACNRQPAPNARLVHNPKRATCRVCHAAHNAQTRPCRDCGRQFKQHGSLCNACRIYQRRNNGQPRRRRRKPTRVDIHPNQLRQLHRLYRSGATWRQLEDASGLVGNTIKQKFKDAGLPLYNGRNPQRRRALFPRHPHARPAPNHVTNHEDSLLAAIEALKFAHKPLTAANLAACSRYACYQSVHKAIKKLAARGFLTGRGRHLQLTPLALSRCVRPSARQRMAESYKETMNGADLAHAAGVALPTAQAFIREKKKT